jgi:hypothetical protein
MIRTLPIVAKKQHARIAIILPFGKVWQGELDFDHPFTRGKTQ